MRYVQSTFFLANWLLKVFKEFLERFSHNIKNKKKQTESSSLFFVFDIVWEYLEEFWKIVKSNIKSNLDQVLI